MKNIGQYKLNEIMPHINEIAKQYNLDPSNIKHFEILRKLLIHRFYSVPELFEEETETN
jgi:hypothetical protein